MKPVIRYQSQFSFAASYKPTRVIKSDQRRNLNVTFRPARRFNFKPQPELVS